MKKIFLFILLFIPFSVFASEEITDSCQILINGIDIQNIHDTKYTTYTDFTSDDIVTINCNEEFKYVYVYYNQKSSLGILSDNKQKINIGENNFLHELISLDNMTNSVSLNYSEDYSISDIFIFGDTISSWVENWQIIDTADILLFPTYFSDENLYFAGLIPTYVNQGKKIQLVYFSYNQNENKYIHETLESLWAMGIKYYPEFNFIPYFEVNTLEDAQTKLNELNLSEDDILKNIVAKIRKYKPNIIVGFNQVDEYPNGLYLLNSYFLNKAIKLSSDKEYIIDGFETFDLKKVYLYDYGENQINLDYSLPLELFNNKNAFEVNADAFNKHYSLKNDAINFEDYSSDKYGLYYSSVGEDILKNDMFENINDDTISDKKEYKIHEYEIKMPTYVQNIYKQKMFIFGLILTIVSGGGLIIIFAVHRKKRKRKLS